jgi:hypothetical protein
MRTLGYIVSKRKVNDCVGFVSVVSDISKVEDRTLPTLIVGIEEAKKYRKDFSILDKRLGGNLFWTFGKTEKRSDYEYDINRFFCHIMDNEIGKIRYYYVNPFKLKFSKAKALLNIVFNEKDKYVFVDKSMIYIYYNNYVLGVSTQVCEYIGIGKEKILKLVKSNKSNKICYNDSFLDSNFKKIISDKKYATAYCYMLSLS